MLSHNIMISPSNRVYSNVIAICIVDAYHMQKQYISGLIGEAIEPPTFPEFLDELAYQLATNDMGEQQERALRSHDLNEHLQVTNGTCYIIIS